MLTRPPPLLQAADPLQPEREDLSRRRAELVAAGLVRPKAFPWSATVDGVVDVYRSAAGAA